MILAIDVGNTHTVIGCCSGDEILFVERISTKLTATVLEYAISFKTILDLYRITPNDIDGAIISSVVPSVTGGISLAVKKVTDTDAMIIKPGLKTGLNITIDNPAQLGSDLVVGAAAVIAEYSLPIILIDMGTATTVSVIDENRVFLGGMIIPGVGISLSALTDRTSQLPKISLEAPTKAIGTNTIDCMKSGIIFSTASSIDGIVERIEDELGSSATVIATGGLASSIIPHCKRDIIVDDELMLKGLLLIYNKNK